MQKNQLIDSEKSLKKDVIKPKISNPLPPKRRTYYILDGRVIFEYQEALQAKESETHNR